MKKIFVLLLLTLFALTSCTDYIAILPANSVYRCEVKNINSECFGGLSGGKHTRCYTDADKTKYVTCSEGWDIVKVSSICSQYKLCTKYKDIWPLEYDCLGIESKEFDSFCTIVSDVQCYNKYNVYDYYCVDE